MVKWLSEKLFGTKSERDLKKLTPYVGLINDFESRIRELSDDALRAKTGEVREKLAQGAALDDLLPEAFAVVREAARRTMGMRPFDVQLIGGVVLHQGKIAEMKTGEGNPRLHPPRVPQRPGRPGRPYRHGQRLSGQAGHGMDGPHSSLSRADGRDDPA